MFYPQDVLQDYSSLSGRNTALETALVSTPLFRAHHLRLYRQNISFLNPNQERIDYLVVKDHMPVLKLILSPWRTKDGERYIPATGDEPPLLVLCTKKRLQDLADDMTAHLKPLLESPDGPCKKRDTYLTVPPEYHEAMACLHMIQKQQDHLWARTGYGDWLGLMDGYTVTEQGKPCHAFFIPSERSAELYRAINWNQTCRDELEDAMSLAQRLERIGQGLPLNNARTVEAVQAFGSISMTDYMACEPEFFEDLNRKFGEAATLQEAANSIFRFYTKPNDLNDRMECVAALALPLYKIHDGEAPANQAAKPVQALLRLPYPSVLMGTAMASGQPRLLRNVSLIQDALKDKGIAVTDTCWKALCGLRGMEGEEITDLLFRLIVEPFALLHRAAAGPSPAAA